MTWLAPWMLAGSALAGLVMAALHLIAWDRPAPAPLPTARFVPSAKDVPAARRRHLVDRWLLLLRLLIILLVGAAFAKPVLLPGRTGAQRIVLADESQVPAAVRESLRVISRAGDLVVRDSARGAGSLSALLVRGIRAAAAARARADSSELLLVSPLLAESVDDATLAIRRAWPGRLRIVRVSIAAAPIPSPRRIDVRGPVDDPVIAAARLVEAGGWHARLVRAPMNANDSTLARNGGTVVAWPSSGGVAVEGALIGRTTVAAGPFARPQAPARSALVVLRWPDGTPAAHEEPLGAGCVRTVFAGVPEGDVVLRPRFLALLRELAGPCASRAGRVGAGDSVVRALEAPVPVRVAAADATEGVPLAPWLFLAAAMAVIAELAVRRAR